VAAPSHDLEARGIAQGPDKTLETDSTDSENIVLVEWLSGAFSGTFEAVPQDWIQNFDPNNVDEDESYVVEWQKAPKAKSGSWHVYDARIYEVSSKCFSF